LDYGESHLSAALIVDREVKAMKSAETGCGAINRALKEQLQLSYSDAEKRKLAHDFSTVPGEIDDVTGIMTLVADGMLKEAKAAIDFCREVSERSARIDQILLIGGGSQLAGFAAAHETQFGAPAVVVNPFKNIELYKSAKQSAERDIGKLAP